MDISRQDRYERSLNDFQRSLNGYDITILVLLLFNKYILYLSVGNNWFKIK